MSVVIDLSHSVLPPFKHQIVGVEKLVEHPYFFLADTMGLGKSKMVIDASQVLYHRGAIDRVVIICPASVRSVWFDPELSELKKHLWANTPAVITEYHAKRRQWTSGPPSDTPLRYVVTNVDYIRDDARMKYLRAHCGTKTLLVIDESSTPVVLGRDVW